MKNGLNSTAIAIFLTLAASLLFSASALAKDVTHRAARVAPAITAEQAISTVQSALPKLTAGKSIVIYGQNGEIQQEVALLLDAKIVSRIRINPATGEILPKGLNIPARELLTTPAQAVTIVQQAILKLEVASVQLGKHGEWKVDVTLNKAVVTSIMIHGDNGSIVPDWKEPMRHHNKPLPRDHK